MDYISCGYPDLSYHGDSAWRPRMDSYSRQIGMMFCSKYAKAGDDTLLYLAVNMYWEPGQLAMPKLPKGQKWKLCIATEEGLQDMAGTEVQIPGRCCAVYINVQDETFVNPKKTSSKVADVYRDCTAF